MYNIDMYIRTAATHEVYSIEETWKIIILWFISRFIPRITPSLLIGDPNFCYDVCDHIWHYTDKTESERIPLYTFFCKLRSMKNTF